MAVKGQAVLDAEAGSGSVHVVIDADSVTTGSRVLDQVLKGEDFFAVERHPAVIYKSSSLSLRLCVEIAFSNACRRSRPVRSSPAPGCS
ncbi:MAG: YceI family protein [Pseudomonadota bacterium]